MRKIKYPIDPTEYTKFTDDYISRFGSVIEKYTKQKKLNKGCKEYKWQKFKRIHNVDAIFPKSVKELLVAPYAELADYYEKFLSIGFSDSDMKNLANIFNYDGYDDKIAKFFVDYADELHLHSCFYCEISYVNAYDVAGTSKKYFDLDHVLPKSKCPILALSLFNFVPSCQVCNSRIKKNEPIGNDKSERMVLSPTSDFYDFENNVRFRLRPRSVSITNKNGRNSFAANPSSFSVCVKASKPYNQEVKFFHLQERYEYHKMEALRLKDLKARYSKAHIKDVAKVLRISVSMVEEDIFHKKFLANNDRCLRKFTLDMLK